MNNVKFWNLTCGFVL